MIPYKLLPFFIKPKNNGNEPGIKLNEDELENLVNFAEKKGFRVQDLNDLLMDGEVRRGEKVIRIGWFVLDIHNDSANRTDRDPYYISFAQGTDGKYAYYDKNEIYRLKDMKLWSEIKKEKRLEELKMELASKPKTKDDFLHELKTRFLGK